MKYFPLILFFVFCFGCGRPSETQVDTMCFDLDKLSDDVRFSDLFERVDLIPLETSDSSLLTPALILAAYHDTLYVMDFMQNKDIKVYDPQGKYLYSLCSRGGGPDDYIAAMNISINPFTGHFELLENNNVLDVYRRKDGKKMRKLELGSERFPAPAQQCFALEEGKYAVFSSFSAQDNVLLYNADTEGRTLLTKPSAENIIAAGRNYTFTAFRRQPSGILTVNAVADRMIYRYDRGEISPYIELDFGQRHNMDHYISDETSPTDIKNILKEHQTEIVSSVFPPLIWNDRFLCTVVMNGENYTLFSGMPDGENVCFKTTSEGLTLSTGGFLDGEVLYLAVPVDYLDKYVSEAVLDEENRAILRSLSPEDNPVVLRYMLKE